MLGGASHMIHYLTHATLAKMVRLAGFEPTTTSLEGRCSIQLSYRRIYI
jgi:hypothetical protein